jgi:hypothetical protein
MSQDVFGTALSDLSQSTKGIQMGFFFLQISILEKNVNQMYAIWVQFDLTCALSTRVN